MPIHATLWFIFAALVTLILVLDLVVFNKKPHAVGVKEALKLSLLWISLALVYNLIIYLSLGPEPAMKFLTGYLVEESLSVDNLFVFIIIFSYFRVDERYRHKVLFWGIAGAMLMRAAFIFAGISVITRFHWVIYILGAFLIFSGIKMFSEKEKQIDPGKNPVLGAMRRFMPVTDDYRDGNFFISAAGKYIATPLFIVLVVIETTDIVFAVDSIPAIFGITTDPFIVYTSNIFAIVGLRAMFFALAGIMKTFRYLNYGIAVILVFIGIKMLAADFYKIPVGVALGTVAGILTVSVVLSLLKPCGTRRGVT